MLIKAQIGWGSKMLIVNIPAKHDPGLLRIKVEHDSSNSGIPFKLELSVGVRGVHHNAMVLVGCLPRTACASKGLWSFCTCAKDKQHPPLHNKARARGPPFEVRSSQAVNKPWSGHWLNLQSSSEEKETAIIVLKKELTKQAPKCPKCLILNEILYQLLSCPCISSCALDFTARCLSEKSKHRGSESWPSRNPPPHAAHRPHPHPAHDGKVSNLRCFVLCLVPLSNVLLSSCRAEDAQCPEHPRLASM